MSDSAANIELPLARPATRWIQLGLGLICMMAISSPQYVWTLFTKPLSGALGVSPAALQVTFSLLIVLQTFFSPFQGNLVDRFGPRLLIAIGAVLTGLSWVLAAQAGSLTMLYLTYGIIGGLGTGIVYVGVLGQMVGWFPDRRGFAAGVVAAGYGMGAIVTTFPIANALASSGHRSALVQFGVIFGVVGFVAALGLKAPPSTDEAARGGVSTPTGTMLRTPIFWLMFVMMSLMSTSGLMVTSQIATFGADFGITQAMVFGLAALPLALTVDRFTNGLTRPFFGWLSDRIGRENTMCLAFALEGVAMTLWLVTRGDPLLFVLLSGLVSSAGARSSRCFPRH
jgi:MFS transporter, OFA family, oxalate/formate antiporter